MTTIKLNRVKAYRTTDGILMEDREAYLAHERQLKFGAQIKTLLEDSFVGEDDHPDNINLGLDEALKFIVDNADKLRDILTGKKKRARAVKKVAPVVDQPAV